MDRVEWWVKYLADELEGCAEIVYEAAPLDGTAISLSDIGVAATVTISPVEPTALAMRIRAGGHDVPTVTFGDVTDVRCFGIPPTGDHAGLDPSNHLGVMVAAVISDGASLLQRSSRRQTLVLGRPPARVALAKQATIESWAPYAETYGTLTMFRRPPAYDELPPSAFLLPRRIGRFSWNE